MSSDIVGVVTNIVRADSLDAAFEAAEEAAAGFERPRSVISADEEDLLLAGSVEGLINIRQNAARETRLNSDRCRSWFADDEEFSTLLELAEYRAVIDAAPDFVPS